MSARDTAKRHPPGLGRGGSGEPLDEAVGVLRRFGVWHCARVVCQCFTGVVGSVVMIYEEIKDRYVQACMNYCSVKNPRVKYLCDYSPVKYREIHGEELEGHMMAVNNPMALLLVESRSRS